MHKSLSHAENGTHRPQGWLHTLVGSRTLSQTTFEKILLYIDEEVETKQWIRRGTDDYILRFRCRGNLPSNVIAQRDEPTELRVGRGGGTTPGKCDAS